jgi:hypothetical protein
VQEAIKENQEQGKLKIARFEEKHLLVGPLPRAMKKLQLLCLLMTP